MTKERLEEIRKRKHAEDRIVYTVFDNDEEATALHITYDNELFVACMILKKVYETKEEAEWYAKTYAERIKRFEPPMWNKIENYYDFRFIVNNKCLRLYVRKDVDYIIIFTEDDDRIFEASATKENYKKACELVRDLFKEVK